MPPQTEDSTAIVTRTAHRGASQGFGAALSPILAEAVEPSVRSQEGHSVGLPGSITPIGSRFYLATTALREFWGPAEETVLLGGWCAPGSWREGASTPRILTGPWEGEAGRCRAAETVPLVAGMVETVLPVLADKLAEMHGEPLSARSWRILLGPWLNMYIPSLYDRFLSVRHALRSWPDLVTVGLDHASRVTAVDSWGYEQLLKQDGLNLQIFTRLLEESGKVTEYRPYPISHPAPPWTDRRSRPLLKTVVRSVIERLSVFGASEAVFLSESYLPRASQLRILLRTRGRVRPLVVSRFVPSSPSVQATSRSALRDLDLGAEPFHRTLSRMLPEDLPWVYVEGFGHLGRHVQAHYPPPPEAVFTCASWYFDEGFKLWAARCSEQGSVLLGSQHGGNYGIESASLSQRHEMAVSNRYYTWGWTSADRNAPPTVPMPATKLIGRRILGASPAKSGVLYGATAYPRYLRTFPQTHERFAEYLEWQERLAASLPKHIRENLRYRPHNEDFGWDIVARWRRACPESVIDSWSTPFWESLRRCRVYLCDHLSTTLAEALSSDVPTVAFWPDHAHAIRVEATSSIEGLRDAGILFRTPEEAAKALSEAYGDIAAWWTTSERGAAVATFCDSYALKSSAAEREWAVELDRHAGDGARATATPGPS